MFRTWDQSNVHASPKKIRPTWPTLCWSSLRPRGCKWCHCRTDAWTPKSIATSQNNLRKISTVHTGTWTASRIWPLFTYVSHYGSDRNDVSCSHVWPSSTHDNGFSCGRLRDILHTESTLQPEFDICRMQQIGGFCWVGKWELTTLNLGRETFRDNWALPTEISQREDRT